MAAGGRHPTEGVRTRLGRGRPNWWVILAVSLALIALLVETSGNRGSQGSPFHVQAAADRARRGHSASSRNAAAARRDAAVSSSSTTTRTTTKPVPTTVPSTSAPVVDAHTAGTTVTPQVLAAGTTTTTAPPATTTTTTTQAALPSDRQGEGYLTPPGETSDAFVFSGSGTILAEWSGDVYLSMTVSCPGSSQTVGGSDSIGIPIDSTGNCEATVSEPSSESTAVAFTITGPDNG